MRQTRLERELVNEPAGVSGGLADAEEGERGSPRSKENWSVVRVREKQSESIKGGRRRGSAGSNSYGAIIHTVWSR